jgi:hypothetical protein
MLATCNIILISKQNTAGRTPDADQKGRYKMKKISRNELKNKPVIKIGYCAAQSMLGLFDRIGYMSGVYGWNCSVYEFQDAYILTGYRMPVKGIRENYQLTDAFNGYVQEYCYEHYKDSYTDVRDYVEKVFIRRYIKKTLLYSK